ncbi:MAG: hypothetical protein C0616_11815 [Desulfuromonas sp.]|nr:MAG: hypothetical protein C0616_11815 [Desulfuromonas sp.]
MDQRPSKLTRDELDLLVLYRELPVEEQLELLEQLEIRCNIARRMMELSIRSKERGILVS